jgi:threonyl-tRNA synthetase
MVGVMVKGAAKEERITLQLPDGSSLEVVAGTTPAEVAASIGSRLAKAAVAAELNGQLIELWRPLQEGGEFKVHTFDSEAGQEVFWHSSAHLTAQAVKRIYPKAKLAIGPPVEGGYYYDIDFGEPISDEAFEAIEAEMQRIVEEDLEIEYSILPVEEAKRFFADQDETYKVRILEDLQEDEEVGLQGGDQVSLYTQGEWTDLCRGPHVPSTGYLKAFKLTRLAGAYWRGDAANEQLQRVYGVSFPKQAQLNKHLEMLEEARKRDHRRLGREMDLFSFQEEGPGFPFWHPNGMVIYNTIVDYVRFKLAERDYREIKTPYILNADLWHRSGHWEHYRENMYFVDVDEVLYAVKPMNCPGACLIYKSDLRSYRDLPLRLAEMGIVHRHEMSGVLHGLTRVRAFNLDDAHIYCTADQIQEEVADTLALVQEVYQDLGFEDYKVELSTRPEKYAGTVEMWDRAESDLKEALSSTGIEYAINEGDGAFYGPKIDFHIRDSLGRSWQLGTVQLDYSMPEAFELEYVGSDGQRHRPVMIHRALLGSVERFIGILIEHYAGDFPLWLAPRQVLVIPVGEGHRDHAREVAAILEKDGVRVEVDDRNEKVGYKIREGEIGRVPFMLVVGEQESADGTVSVRRRKEGDLGSMSLETFVAMVKKERFNYS